MPAQQLGRHALKIRPMNLFIQLVSWLSRIAGVVAAVMIAVAVLVVCQLVFMRYGLGESTYWQVEFVSYLLIGATFIGSPYVLLTRGHVNVDLLPSYLGKRARFFMAMFAASVSLIFCLVLAWTGFTLWYESWALGWHSDSVWAVRLWIPFLAMPIGMGLMSLQYVADMLRL